MTPSETTSSLTLEILEPRWTKKPKNSKAKCVPHPTVSVYVGMYLLYSLLCGVTHYIGLIMMFIVMGLTIRATYRQWRDLRDLTAKGKKGNMITG